MSLLSSWFGKKEDSPEKTSRQILLDILKTMREGVIIIAEDNRIIASNQMACDAFDRNNEALENKRLSETIRDLSVHEAFRKALENDKSSEVKFEVLANEKRIFSVRVAPINLEENKHAIGIFYEQTQIEHLEKVRQEFLSNVSHELRTPLTSILAFVETLEDGAIEDKENNRRFLAVIRKNAERMHHLIDDVSELSSIEAGKIIIEPKNVLLSGFVDEIFVNLSSKANERKIKFENQIKSQKTVWADKIRLEQMLTNLIDNAIKFNREGGQLTINLEEKDDVQIISVSDEGEGISNKHLQRIFERFYRTDRARSREIGGTGLGLAIVKHLARLHGGEASVFSTLDKGSTFTIQLPKKSPLISNQINITKDLND